MKRRYSWEIFRFQLLESYTNGQKSEEDKQKQRKETSSCKLLIKLILQSTVPGFLHPAMVLCIQDLYGATEYGGLGRTMLMLRKTNITLRSGTYLQLVSVAFLHHARLERENSRKASLDVDNLNFNAALDFFSAKESFISRNKPNSANSEMGSKSVHTRNPGSITQARGSL